MLPMVRRLLLAVRQIRVHSGGMTNASKNHVNVTELIDSLPKGLFLGGEFVDGSSGEFLEVENPATGEVLAKVASATQEDAQRALEEAAKAQPKWAATPARDRSEILRKSFELITEHARELAVIQSLELGRALPDSEGEVTYGAEFFRWFAEEAVRVRGDYRQSPSGNARLIVTKQPVGPTLAVTPWNFPLAMGTRKIGPAFAAGCTMIVKPASKTPLTMLFLAKLMKEAGLPDGVLAVLPSKTASDVSAILSNDRLRKLTFTGSTEVGQALGEEAAKRSLRVSMELGGNAPFVVLEDADVDVAIEAVKGAKMRGAGQVCIAANRFIVHESVHDEFVEKVTELMGSYTVGDPLNEGVTVGPLSGADQLETVSELVKDALAKGATRTVGDTLPDGLAEGGHYFAPTVLTGITGEMKIANTEIFGPVVAIQKFSDEDEAIRAANDTPFGLAAYVFSADTLHAIRVAEKIEAGMVAINKGAISDAAAPFGGVKESGLGREGGFEGIGEYLEEKFITLPM